MNDRIASREAKDGQVGAELSASRVLDDFFRHYYARHPVNATFTGIHDYDGELPDWSPEGIDETAAEMRHLLLRLATSDNSLDTDYPHGADRTLAAGFLEIRLAELDGDHFQRRNPALHTGEAVFAVLSLMIRDFAPAVERAEAIETRLREITRFLESSKITIDHRAIPRSWIARAINECHGAIQAFGDGLQLWCADQELPRAIQHSMARAASEALLAFQDFKMWLQERAEALPQQSGCGPDFYDLLLSRGHWCARSRHDLLQEAHERFDEAVASLDAMAKKQDPGGWAAVTARLSNRHPTADDYLHSYQRTWDACREHAIDRNLVTWPDFPIRYVELPAWARCAAPELYFLNYRSPAPFDRQEVVEYLAPALTGAPDEASRQILLRTVNNSVIKLNHVVHHGALGHHVQNFNAYRCASRLGQVAAVDCASRIGMFCGGSMAEGWACYATDLMGETGFLTDLELVAEQHSRVRQLARAIVDIELHQHSMNEAHARAFHEERVGMAPAAAHKEVTRTSMFPGTAIMYWLGTQAIHDLRASRQAEEGTSFSLRNFHDRFLSFGSIPVLMISDLMSQESSE